MSEQTKPKPFSSITEAMLNEWKSKHAPQKVTIAAIPKGDPDDTSADEGESLFVVVDPDRKQTEVLTTYALKNQIAQGNNLMIKSLVLGGDMDDLDDSDTYNALIEYIGLRIAKKKARSVSSSEIFQSKKAKKAGS